MKGAGSIGEAVGGSQTAAEGEKHCLPARCEEHKGNTKPKEMLDQGC